MVGRDHTGACRNLARDARRAARASLRGTTGCSSDLAFTPPLSAITPTHFYGHARARRILDRTAPQPERADWRARASGSLRKLPHGGGDRLQDTKEHRHGGD